MARKENNTSQQTAPKVMNEKLFYFEFYTASKVINRGSKIHVEPFTAKVLSACEKEKITVYAEETIFTNRVSSGNEHINSVRFKCHMETSNIHFSS